MATLRFTTPRVCHMLRSFDICQFADERWRHAMLMAISPLRRCGFFILARAQSVMPAYVISRYPEERAAIDAADARCCCRHDVKEAARWRWQRRCWRAMLAALSYAEMRSD
jgi:hypothetical protein